MTHGNEERTGCLAAVRAFAENDPLLRADGRIIAQAALTAAALTALMLMAKWAVDGWL